MSALKQLKGKMRGGVWALSDYDLRNKKETPLQ